MKLCRINKDRTLQVVNDCGTTTKVIAHVKLTENFIVVIVYGKYVLRACHVQTIIRFISDGQRADNMLHNILGTLLRSEAQWARRQQPRTVKYKEVNFQVSVVKSDGSSIESPSVTREASASMCRGLLN